MTYWAIIILIAALMLFWFAWRPVKQRRPHSGLAAHGYQKGTEMWR